MPEADGKPLYERVFLIKAAIRKAGFRAHGRIRLDAQGRAVLGIVVPISFDDGEITPKKVKSLLRYQIEKLELPRTRRPALI